MCLWRMPLRLPLLSWLLVFILGADAASHATIQFLKAPRSFSPFSSATFVFEVREGRNGDLCSNCSVSCKLDNYNSSNCKSRQVTYSGLHDGNHTFEVCANRSQGARCDSYHWNIDTVAPTAHVRAASTFTSASNVSVHISFTEPCPGGGGFRCFQNHCNLLVYGAGHILPSTLKILQPDLEFSLIVGIPTDILYGRLLLVMDRSFCTDAAGNRFTRTSNSSFTLHFDRRYVFSNITTSIPKKFLKLNGERRAVEATNNDKNLKIYLSFSEPVLNSSAEIFGALQTSNGIVIPTNRSSHGNRRFGYIVKNTSNMAIVTINCDTSSIISRQGTPVSPLDPFTFLYDDQRPSVKVTTTKMRTREHIIPVFIKFVKPIFDFNSSAILITGGHLLRFQEKSKSIYTIEVHADEKVVSVEIAENTTQDFAGNSNLASNRLQVRHYSVPVLSSVVSIVTTVAFVATAMVAALLTYSTSSLVSSGAFSRPAAHIISEPSRSLLRIASHIQVFALSRWLAVNLPIEYYEFARGIQWIIPYFGLPWEDPATDSFTGYSTLPVVAYSKSQGSSKPKTMGSSRITTRNLHMEASLDGKLLTPLEYRSFFEDQNMIPQAEFISNTQNLHGWDSFGRNMFWLAVIGGGLVLLHAVVIFTFRLRKKNSEKHKDVGALVFPRFEIFLIFLALPCSCQASAAVIRGGSTAGVVVGTVLLGIVASLLISLLMFLSLGIMMGKLLVYKEVHQEGQEYHWYQEIIRVTLGPGKRGQWTWNGQQNTVCLTKLGPLFEDLRGPPKYMLSQISSGGNGRRIEADRIIASEDETEDAEAPFIQKLFGILRIYYTFLECVKRVTLGVVAGAYSSNRSSKFPTIIVLSITSFQLFFLVLKKPFIKKRVQLVEIMSVASEVAVFACFLLIEKDFLDADERNVGFFMIVVFIVGFTAQMINEWYALYLQVLWLSPDKNSFSMGLKTVVTGFLLTVLPSRLLSDLNEQLSSNSGDGDAGFTISPHGQMQRSSGTNERSWLRQLREMAKASFTREDAGGPNDPSSSTNQRNGFRSGKRTRSSSVTSSADFQTKGELRAKSKGLYKDLEAIFSSK
ncbi:uncharacterized protein [Typha latifolia]|uniref:uncharacterized protein n=1 Tax=Typha latifolia TaxID=4733 RepID=UPI003C2BC103